MKNLRLFLALIAICGMVACEQSLENGSEVVNYQENLATPSFMRGGDPRLEAVYALAAEYGDNIREDDGLDPETSLRFENFQDLKEFIKGQQQFTTGDANAEPQDPDENWDYTTSGCKDGTYTASFNAGMGNLLFDVVVRDGKVISVGSRMTGWVLGTSYTQSSFSITGSTVTVTGTFNYNLFFEGAGTVYSQGTTHTIHMPC